MLAIGVTICALASPSVAGADPDPIALNGPLGESGRAHVSVSYFQRDGQHFRKYRYSFTRIELNCEGEDRIARDPVTGKEWIWAKFADRNPFGLTVVAGPANDPIYKATVHGKLVRPDKSRGFVRVSGRGVALRGGGKGTCDSGRLRWAVR